MFKVINKCESEDSIVKWSHQFLQLAANWKHAWHQFIRHEIQRKHKSPGVAAALISASLHLLAHIHHSPGTSDPVLALNLLGAIFPA